MNTLSTQSSQLPLDDIVEGECIQTLSTLPEGSVDLIFADPPYNLSGKGMKWQGKMDGGDWHKVNERWDHMTSDDYGAFTRAWLDESFRILKPGGGIYVCATLHNLGTVLMMLEGVGFRALNLITWNKPNAMPSMTRRSYTHSCEFIAYFCKGKGWTYNYEDMKELNPNRRKDGGPKQMRDLWTFPVCQGKERLKGENGRALHPTQKPEVLVERCVLASSHPGDVILDPFMGSGTTAVVSKRNGRRFVGVERDGADRAAALQRLASMDGR